MAAAARLRSCACLAWRFCVGTGGLGQQHVWPTLRQQLSTFCQRQPVTTLSLPRQLIFTSNPKFLAASPPSARPVASSIFVRNCATIAAESSEGAPTLRQLKVLALHAALPMVGFGLMDQTIMIQAGDLIDSTIGSKLALPTLAAAACGQVFSDFSGVIFGGTVEAAASRLGLPLHGLTLNQLEHPRAKRWQTMGAACGVVVGCLLGMTQMLFMDLQRDEQIQQFAQMDSVVRELLKDDALKLHADRCVLYFVDQEKELLWTMSQSTDGNSAVFVEMPWTSGISGACARNGKVYNVPDAYNCEFFNPVYDRQSMGARFTKSVLCVPVMALQTEQVFAVLQFINKNDDGKITTFSREDEEAALQMANYVSILRPALQPLMENTLSSRRVTLH